MPDREKLFDALRNCVTEPKCKDCPWEDCEQIGCKRTKVPVTLLLDTLNVLKEQPQWISVKDRMPDAAGYECLVCAVNENYNQTHVFTAHTGYGEPGWWTGNVHYMSRVTSPSDNRLHPALNVTHWMPLPEPPEEVKQDARP